MPMTPWVEFNIAGVIFGGFSAMLMGAMALILLVSGISASKVIECRWPAAIGCGCLLAALPAAAALYALSLVVVSIRELIPYVW